jgi:hypothetical protein
MVNLKALTLLDSLVKNLSHSFHMALASDKKLLQILANLCRSKHIHVGTEARGFVNMCALNFQGDPQLDNFTRLFTQLKGLGVQFPVAPVYNQNTTANEHNNTNSDGKQNPPSGGEHKEEDFVTYYKRKSENEVAALFVLSKMLRQQLADLTTDKQVQPGNNTTTEGPPRALLVSKLTMARDRIIKAIAEIEDEGTLALFLGCLDELQICLAYNAAVSEGKTYEAPPQQELKQQQQQQQQQQEEEEEEAEVPVVEQKEPEKTAVVAEAAVAVAVVEEIAEEIPEAVIIDASTAPLDTLKALTTISLSDEDEPAANIIHTD